MPVRLSKTVAAFVLLWALADMTVPGLCQADDNKINSNNNLILLSLQDAQRISSVSNQAPSKGSDGLLDECFCCSPYACPATVFSSHKLPNTTPCSMSSAVFIATSLFPQPIVQSYVVAERRRLIDLPTISAAPLRC
jgi:hypothetical protein